MATTAPSPGVGSVDAVELRRFLDGEYGIVREHVRAVLSRPEFAKDEASPPTAEYREQVMRWAQTLADTGGPALLFPPEFGGLGRVGAAIASFETLAHSDLSLLVKCGVQFGLFGGAVHHLGTRRVSSHVLSPRRRSRNGAHSAVSRPRCRGGRPCPRPEKLEVAQRDARGGSR